MLYGIIIMINNQCCVIITSVASRILFIFVVTIMYYKVMV